MRPRIHLASSSTLKFVHRKVDDVSLGVNAATRVRYISKRSKSKASKQVRTLTT